jgi:hypothetical protein
MLNALPLSRDPDVRASLWRLSEKQLRNQADGAVREVVLL